MALKLADYVVTEAGFGADLGAEKFMNIKCRKAGLKPDVAVIVATVRALKYHGGIDVKELTDENLSALDKGMANLKRHLSNMQDHFGVQCVVAINQFVNDTDAEIELIRSEVEKMGAKVVLAKHWAEGGEGATTLAHQVVELIDSAQSNFQLLYEDDVALVDKINKVAKQLYGAAEVIIERKALDKLQRYSETHAHVPVCMAKTPYSFSSDLSLRGAPLGHTLTVRDVRLSRGAEFIVALCGDIMTMPGLPKRPASERIDVNAFGEISGLF
jgi:formate--tetrahydrofolate ligase